MFDLEVDDGVFDDGRRVDVGGGDDVGDVAVHEDVAGLEAEDGGFGAAGVGAAEPDCKLVRGVGGKEEEGEAYGFGGIGRLRAWGRRLGFGALCSLPRRCWSSGRRGSCLLFFWGDVVSLLDACRLGSGEDKRRGGENTP